MIAPRQTLRLACAAISRAAGNRVRAIDPPPLRWRRGRPVATGSCVPGRLASCIVRLQQHLDLHLHLHLHLHLRPQLHFKPAIPAGRPGMPARVKPTTWSPMARAGLPASGWSATRITSWTALAPFARAAPPVAASAAQVVRAPAAAAVFRVAIARVLPAHRAPGLRDTRPLPNRPGEMARCSGAQARRLAGAGAALHAPALPALSTLPALPSLPMRRTMVQRAHPGTRCSRLVELRMPVPADLAQRAPMPCAANPPCAVATPPVMLAWRRYASMTSAPCAPEPAQWIQGDVPASPARYGANSRAAAPAPLSAASIAPVFPALGTAAADRLADDIVRRVERQLRIERERRGL